jgi:hypothetical protein
VVVEQSPDVGARTAGQPDDPIDPPGLLRFDGAVSIIGM